MSPGPVRMLSCAILLQAKLLEKLPARERFILLEVADLRSRACEVNFGTGMPLKAQQAMLPDMIKSWQPKADGPVQIIYGGYAAKIMRRK